MIDVTPKYIRRPLIPARAFGYNKQPARRYRAARYSELQ